MNKLILQNSFTKDYRTQKRYIRNEEDAFLVETGHSKLEYIVYYRNGFNWEKIKTERNTTLIEIKKFIKAFDVVKHITRGNR